MTRIVVERHLFDRSWPPVKFAGEHVAEYAAAEALLRLRIAEWWPS